MKEVKNGFPSQQACIDWSNKVAPLLKFNQQYYINFINNAHKMNFRLSSDTLVPAFNIMVSQLQMAINELENEEEEDYQNIKMKKKIKIFVSYARANKDLAKKFLEKFREQVAPAKKYEYIFWGDTEILVGEKWHNEIQEALKECNLGLLLVSPAFLGSQYINEHELPKFVKSDANLLIPIMLQQVDFERHDLKGLQNAQIFRLDSPRFQSPKAYGDCTGGQRDRFVQELFRQVESRLDKLAGG